MWRLRKKPTTPVPVDVKAREEARNARAEVASVSAEVQARHGRLLQIGYACAELRAENHFSYKIFGES